MSELNIQNSCPKFEACPVVKELADDADFWAGCLTMTQEILDSGINDGRIQFDVPRTPYPKISPIRDLHGGAEDMVATIADLNARLSGGDCDGAIKVSEGRIDRSRLTVWRLIASKVGFDTLPRRPDDVACGNSRGTEIAASYVSSVGSQASRVVQRVLTPELIEAFRAEGR